MATFQNTLAIPRPVDDVFAFLADFENIPTWNYAIVETKKTSPGPVGVGTTYRQLRSIPDRSEEGFEVTAFMGLGPARSSLARRLRLALATMLLPVAAVAAAGLVTFRQSISALEEFRQETVEESKRIEEVRDLLVQADDLGEASVEEEDPATGERFVALGALIDRRFDELQDLATQQERELAAEAEKIWDKSEADIEAANAVPSGDETDDRLDPFHDHIDEAASILADLHSVNGNQVADEIAPLRRREQDQLLTALAALVIGSTVALFLARPSTTSSSSCTTSPSGG